MTPTVLVEGCAGLASLSLAVACGRPTDAPWARPGSKTGYARALLRLAGLTRWRPERMVWCEPAEDCRMMLRAYPDREALTEAARLCQDWGRRYPGPEGQRELWMHLREQGPPGDHSAAEVARVASVQARTVNQAGVRAFGGVSLDDWTPQLRTDGTRGYTDDAPADKLGAIAAGRWPQTELHRDIRELDPIPGALLYLDPPYAGTLGYGEGDLTRAEVLALCERWAAAGALVLASEAVPLADELGAGWHAIDIGSARQGRARINGCVTEWVTMSREPAWQPAVQAGLFGGRR